VISMPPIRHNPHLADYDPTSEEAIEFPAVESLMEPRPVVERAIDILEAYSADRCGEERLPACQQSGHCPDESPEQVREELLELLQSPALIAHRNLSVTFWRLVRNRKRTVLFCRNRSPVANALMHMCMPGDTLSERLLDGALREIDFARLTVGAGRLAHAPVRVCDVREPDTFLRVLFDAHEAFDFAICDWKLAGEELAAAYRLTRDSHVTFLCPE
jgi:hypothetical protein